jgi:hypothetical protein
MPMLVKASRTSSSLNGLMMAITIFIARSIPLLSAPSRRRSSANHPGSCAWFRPPLEGSSQVFGVTT